MRQILKRPLVPLAVCFLAGLSLFDLRPVSFLHPPLPKQLESLVGEKKILEGELLEPPNVGPFNAKVPVQLIQTKEGEPLSGKILLAFPFVPSWERGDRIRFETRVKRPVHYRDPGAFDYRRSLERKGILLTGYISDPEGVEVLGKKPSILRPADRLRQVIFEAIHFHLPSNPDEAGFLSALLVGLRSGIPEALWDDFRRTGTTHVIAISGLHIGMVGAVFYAIFLWLLKRSERLILTLSVRKLAGVLTLVPILLYTLLAGSPPSAVRACILAWFIFLAPLARREVDALSALAFAAIAITLMDPSTPFAASFQLSFLAVLGILLFRYEKSRTEAPAKNYFLKKYVIRPLWMTLGASLLTAPLVATLFHQVSVSGVLTNLWAVPFVSLLILLTSSSLVMLCLINPLGHWLLELSGWACHWFLVSLKLSSRFSWVIHFYPTGVEVFLAYTIVGLLILIRFLPNHRRILIPSLALITVIIIVPFQNLFRRDLEVTFLDVGQGDSALVLTPDGGSLLIDGGGFLIPGRERSEFDVGEQVVVPYLKRRGLKRIDRILLSHPHPDHYGGLKAIVESFPVGEFWQNGQVFPDGSFDVLMKAIDEKGIPRRTLREGNALQWSGLNLDVLFPGRIDPARNINDNSLVVMLSWRESRFLFTGDIERQGEAHLSDRPGLHATVLKIPHHGSKTSSSVPFIDTVQPLYAVASLGDGNHFGFPHPGILEKYERRGVRVFRTDRNGAVTFIVPPEFPRKDISIRTASTAD